MRPGREDCRRLKLDGYRIEKLLFQSRPDVWVTANAYVPERRIGKAAAVLAVHGHWPGARRDPVVQARCLGLVKLGFFVLAVDAFGAGERHPTRARAPITARCWGDALAGRPALLGMQVYDNIRAVDYLLTRPEVDGGQIGITGASGGGNQTMYAGARTSASRPWFRSAPSATIRPTSAACCMCEVLPGALRFTEEGDVLGLVAPRALMVINATRTPPVQRRRGEEEPRPGKADLQLYDAAEKVLHPTFESPHDYNQPMREAMYGWMTRWLKGEGDGKPIPEPKHDIEKVDDLACYEEGKRPATFVFPARSPGARRSGCWRRSTATSATTRRRGRRRR